MKKLFSIFGIFALLAMSATGFAEEHLDCPEGQRDANGCCTERLNDGDRAQPNGQGEIDTSTQVETDSNDE